MNHISAFREKINFLKVLFLKATSQRNNTYFCYFWPTSNSAQDWFSIKREGKNNLNKRLWYRKLQDLYNDTNNAAVSDNTMCCVKKSIQDHKHTFNHKPQLRSHIGWDEDHSYTDPLSVTNANVFFQPNTMAHCYVTVKAVTDRPLAILLFSIEPSTPSNTEVSPFSTEYEML